MLGLESWSWTYGAGAAALTYIIPQLQAQEMWGRWWVKMTKCQDPWVHVLLLSLMRHKPPL